MKDGSIRKPDFFIVGAPRCGTTAMYEYLKQHPEVYMPEHTKEPGFFAKDLYSHYYIRDEKRYLELFSNVTTQKRVGEASAIYLFSKVAAEEIKKFNPDARIIIMLRNPVDMMYSLHSQLVFAGHEDIEDFEEALRAEGDRKKGLRVPESRWPVEFLFYREMARFSVQVERFMRHFDREKIHIIVFDDFKKDTAGVYKETLEFLEVDESFQPGFKIVNPNKRLRNKLLRKIFFPPPMSLQKISRLLIPSKEMRDSLYNSLRRLSIVYEQRKPMAPELRKRLLLEFKEEIERLGLLIDKDLSFWLNEIQ